VGKKHVFGSRDGCRDGLPNSCLRVGDHVIMTESNGGAAAITGFGRPGPKLLNQMSVAV